MGTRVRHTYKKDKGENTKAIRVRCLQVGPQEELPTGERLAGGNAPKQSPSWTPNSPGVEV